MSPWRWVRQGVVVTVIVMTAALCAAPAPAQLVDATRPVRDLSPDPINQSARLLGMGRLTLVIPDIDNHIDLWDFARNPAGIYRADSNSVLQLIPNTSSSSATEDFAEPGFEGERQTGASRVAGVGYEAIRRPKDGTVYGAIGSVDELRYDSPYSVDTERRSQLSNPSVMPVIAGRMPYVLTDRMQYAVRGIFAIEDTRDEYRNMIRNAVGTYLDHEGTVGDPPNTFTPDEYFVRRIGGGASFALHATPWLTAAAGGDITSSEIKGSNDGQRYSSETRETRPLYSGQSSLIGHLGKRLELGVDGRAWSSSSDATWVYALSPRGGPGPSRPPVAGRGNLYSRKDTGSRLRVRGRWNLGRGELGASFGTAYGKTETTPAPLRDPTSFNKFRSNLFATATTGDTLVLPDDIRSSDIQQRAWEAAGGASLHLPGGNGLVGAEYHYLRQQLDQVIGPGAVEEETLHQPSTFSGTRTISWEARSGIEYPCTQVLTGRAGYVYRYEDLDTNTKLNENVSHSVTAGIGLRPVGAMWTMETGYAFEWGQADYGSPARPRFTRQQMAFQFRWDF